MSITEEQSRGDCQHRQVRVLIVGLGPAGSACGMGLADSGLDVLAIDRAHFPRDKICGDALPLNSQTLIEKLGLNDQSPQLQKRSFLAEQGSVRARQYSNRNSHGGWHRNGNGILSGTPCMQTVRRRELDHWLMQRCKDQQLAMQFGWQAERLHWDANEQRWKVSGSIHDPVGQRTGQFAIKAEFVVGCDGAGSMIQRHCHLSQGRPLLALASRCYLGDEAMARSDRGSGEPISRINYRWPGEATYAWAFAVPGGYNCGVAAMPTPEGGHGLRGKELIQRTRLWIDHLLGQLDGQRPIKRPDATAFSQREIRTMAIPVLHPIAQLQPPAGVLLTGDAASLVDPHQGHGIDRAMESGALAAEVLRNGISAGLGPHELTEHFQDRLHTWIEIWRQDWHALALERMDDQALNQALVGLS